jgi:hypothetical protein
VRIAERVKRSPLSTVVLAKNDPIVVTCLMLRRLKAYTEARKIPMMVVMLYAGHGQLSEIDKPIEKSRSVAVADCAVKNGIETVDLWQPLVSLASSDPKTYYGLYHRERWYHGLWGHLTAAGNRFVAREIAQRMRAMGWIRSKAGGPQN